MNKKTQRKANRAFSLSATFVILAFQTGVCSADLVAHWTGNDSVVDATGNGHDGSLVNGTTFSDGVRGGAFQFDGINDHVSVPGSPSLQPSTISIALWISAAPDSGLRLVADSSHGGSGLVNQGGWALQLLGSGQIDFVYGNGTNFPAATSTSIVADNSFHHVVAILNNSQMQVYVDGVLETTAAYSGTPVASIANGGNIRLGNHYQFPRALQGSLDDVRIYNHALTQSQINSLASVPEPTTAGFLIAVVLGLALRRKHA